MRRYNTNYLRNAKTMTVVKILREKFGYSQADIKNIMNQARG